MFKKSVLMIQLFYVFLYVFSEDIKDLNPFQLIKLGEDISQLRSNDVRPSDVTFYLVTQSQPDPVLIKSGNIELVNVTKTTKFVIHGWLENNRRSWYKNMADEYIKKFDLNFVEVDWERPARFAYVSSAKSTKTVGKEICRFIQEANLPPKDIHLIGHSLGAHIAGFAGKCFFEKTGEKIARISGLDPAGPYFREALIKPDDRLDKNDAGVVDAIHTDAGFYGYETPIGTLDIYVNGGQRVQPGCLDDLSSSSFGDILERSFCSHARSCKYFIEWISGGSFNCQFCDPVLGYSLISDRCILHHRDLSLRSEDINSTIAGVCFARTSKEEPYLT